MTTETERYPFDAIMAMCERLGVSSIKDLEGCYEQQVSGEWWIAINGHDEDTEAVTPHGHKVPVPPYTAYLDYNGFPAGLIDPYDGTIAAGVAANVETFMAACDAVRPRKGPRG